MTNSEKWDAFISELRSYVIEHHHCPNKHTTLYNTQKYYRGKMKEGKLDAEKVQQLEEVLAMRTNEHTGGRRKNSLVLQHQRSDKTLSRMNITAK